MKTLLVAAALLAFGNFAALAQTARIAHLSHGGSLETLADAEALDNFGLPEPTFLIDSIRFLSDTTALEYGNWHWTGDRKLEKEKVRTHQFTSRTYGRRPQSAKKYVERSGRYNYEVKVLSYDTLPKPAPVPEVKKQKTKRKKSAFIPAATPTPPQHPGVALAVALILTLSGAGWLLGGRKPQLAA